MPMMNSEARKRQQAASEPLAGITHLADVWDAQAAHEDACGNGFAAAVLHAQARELRAVLSRQMDPGQFVA